MGTLSHTLAHTHTDSCRRSCVRVTHVLCSEDSDLRATSQSPKIIESGKKWRRVLASHQRAAENANVEMRGNGKCGNTKGKGKGERASKNRSFQKRN